MRFGRTLGVALTGLDGHLVTVESTISAGLPRFTVSGLPDATVNQSPERVRAATGMAGVPLPSDKIVVNMSPASVPKVGSGFDLPIAIALLRATGTVAGATAQEVVHLGELGLDGSIRPVPGVLPAVLAAQRAGRQVVVVPTANAREAALVDGVTVHHAASLRELVVDRVVMPGGDGPRGQRHCYLSGHR